MYLDTLTSYDVTLQWKGAHDSRSEHIVKAVSIGLDSDNSLSFSKNMFQKTLIAPGAMNESETSIKRKSMNNEGR